MRPTSSRHNVHIRYPLAAKCRGLAQQPFLRALTPRPVLNRSSTERDGLQRLPQASGVFTLSVLRIRVRPRLGECRQDVVGRVMGLIEMGEWTTIAWIQPGE